MNVPFIDLKRFEPDFLERWNDKVATMSARAEFMGGTEVAGLESRLKAVLQVEHAVSCANGTDALQLALRAAGVGRGDVVLVPDLTFWATFEAVVNVGADPVTVDVDSQDGAMSLAALEEALQVFQPKAAILVHLYGWGSARLEAIRALCARCEVTLIEDGAQCFGVLYEGESIFRQAHLATTSFYPAKVLGAAGDGGAVFARDAAMAERVRRLANHGRTTHYGYGDVGWNSRLDALQAAFLNISLDYLEARIASRREATAFYRDNLPACGVRLMQAPETYRENGYCNVCITDSVEQKSRLEAALKAQGIGFGNIYPGAISAQAGAEGVLKGRVGGAQARSLCASVLNLPLFPYMRDEELERVLSVVKVCLSGEAL